MHESTKYISARLPEQRRYNVYQRIKDLGSCPNFRIAVNESDLHKRLNYHGRIEYRKITELTKNAEFGVSPKYLRLLITIGSLISSKRTFRRGFKQKQAVRTRKEQE